MKFAAWLQFAKTLFLKSGAIELDRSLFENVQKAINLEHELHQPLRIFFFSGFVA